MKQTRNRFLLPVVALMVASSLAGCTKSNPTPKPNSMEITPLIAFSNGSIEAGSSYSSAAHTKAAVSGSEALDLYFARADQTSTSTSTYGDYQATALLATRTAGTGKQSLSFSTKQYYNADNTNTKLTGWYPGGASVIEESSGKGFYDGTTHTVSWKIDGQQDIMTAIAQNGSWTNQMPAITFNHNLTQLQFYPYTETQKAVDAWGKITKIELLNQQNTVIYDLANDATGALSFSGAATNIFSAKIADGGASLSISTTAEKETNAKQMGNSIMIAPQSDANHTLTIRITTENNKYKDVPLTQSFTAGVSYSIYMKFAELKEQDITIETTVDAWKEATTNDNVGEVRIGDYLNGGIVYAVTDAKNYKILSLDQGSSLTWSDKNTYELGTAGQNMADGKSNAAAMNAYSLANTGNTDANKKTTGVFATDFPAANFCDKKNVGGVTGWYLPAKDELVALYTAYKIAANKTAIDAGIAGNGGTAFPASGNFWSSTEYSHNTGNAWLVIFSNGNALTNAKSINNYVRCVRDL